MLVSPVPIVAADPPTDDTLLAGARRGDAPAIDLLIRRYTDFVYAAAMRQTGERHLAEDVTQVVFLVLLRRLDAVRGPILTAWLHRTTRYAAANAIRSAARRRRHERAARQTEVSMPSAEPDPLLPLLDDAIESLNTKDRVAVVERYLRGRDVSAVAMALGSTPAATQKRLERAVEKLRRYFTRRCRTPGATLGAAGLAATLAAAGPSPTAAAPPALVGVVTAAVLSPSTASSAVLAAAKGTIFLMTWNTAKMVAVAVIAASVFSFVGMEVVRHRSAPPAVAARPATVISPADLIRPGLGIGGLRIGMTAAEVTAVMGPAEKSLGGPSDLRWPSRGLMIDLDTNGHVARIMAGDLDPTHPPATLPFRTAESVGVGSPAEAVIAAYGKPATANAAEARAQFIDYAPLGVNFKTQDGWVTLIVVQASEVAANSDALTSPVADPTGPTSPTDITFDQIIDGVRKSESAFQNVHIKDFRTTIELLPTGKTEWTATPLNTTGSAWLDAQPNGRQRFYLTRHVMPWIGGTSDYTETVLDLSWDGTEGRSLSIASGELGKLRRERNIQRFNEPPMLLGPYMRMACGAPLTAQYWVTTADTITPRPPRQSLSEILLSMNKAGVTQEIVAQRTNGFDTVRLRFTSNRGRFTYWFAPDHGFAFIKQIETLRLRKSSRIEGKDVLELKLVGPNLWFPVRGSIVEQDLEKPGYRRWSCTASEVVVNDPVFDPAIFCAPLLDGWMVTDDRDPKRRRSYVQMPNGIEFDTRPGTALPNVPATVHERPDGETPAIARDRKVWW